MIARPFSHVAVLNRGEAAVRFLRAARHWRRQHREPLRILALYTHPDADAPFVRMASSALSLGDPLVPGEGGQLRSAYLDVERVVSLAKAAGADALWPGWGFAAERPELPDACEAHGLVFLGPPVGRHAPAGGQGRGQAARRSHWRAGQSLVAADRWTKRRRRSCAARIGFPVLLKAAAGGGGRGIRRVNDAGGTRARRFAPPRARRRPPSATPRSSSRRSCRRPGTSRCRSSPTRTARCGPSARATARCSGVSRRCSRRRPRPASRRPSRAPSAPPPCRSPARWATSGRARRSSSCSRTARPSTSSR